MLSNHSPTVLCDCLDPSSGIRDIVNINTFAFKCQAFGYLGIPYGFGENLYPFGAGVRAAQKTT